MQPCSYYISLNYLIKIYNIIICGAYFLGNLSSIRENYVDDDYQLVATYRLRRIQYVVLR